MTPRKPISGRERAARALCARQGLPTDTMFEGKPMWQSFLPEVDVVLEAAIGKLEAGTCAFVAEEDDVAALAEAIYYINLDRPGGLEMLKSFKTADKLENLRRRMAEAAARSPHAATGV